MSEALRVLDEIRARIQAAAKGPWKWTDDGLHATRYPFPRTNDGMWIIGSDCNECSVPDDTYCYPIEEANGDLIAHAPADLALLERVARMAATNCDLCGGIGYLVRFKQQEASPFSVSGEPGEPEPHRETCNGIGCRVRRELAKGDGR